MMTVWPVVVGYLLGSVPFAYIAARLGRGIDIRRAGSGNVGATNVLRAAGVWPAVATTVLDAGKGAAAAWLGFAGGGGPGLATASGVAAVVGHVFPVWLGFKGGKGVATTFGAFSVLAPLAAALAAAVFVTTVWASRYVSLGSLVGLVALAPAVWWTTGDGVVTAGSAAVAILVLIMHWGNLLRLRAGAERHLGDRA